MAIIIFNPLAVDLWPPPPNTCLYFYFKIFFTETIDILTITSPSLRQPRTLAGPYYSYPFSIPLICSAATLTFNTDSTIGQTGFRILISTTSRNSTSPTFPTTTLPPHKNVTILHKLLHANDDAITHLEYIQTQLNDDIQELIHVHENIRLPIPTTPLCTTPLFPHYSLVILILTSISLLLSIIFFLNSLLLRRRILPLTHTYRPGRYIPTLSTATLLHSIVPASSSNITCLSSDTFQRFLNSYYCFENHGSLFTFLTRSLGDGLFQSLVLVFLTV